jgi:hypothetical protein
MRKWHPVHMTGTRFAPLVDGSWDSNITNKRHCVPMLIFPSRSSCARVQERCASYTFAVPSSGRDLATWRIFMDMGQPPATGRPWTEVHCLPGESG